MKKNLIFIFLILPLILNATNYYVKTGGNDAAAGTSDATAWATTTKVNTVWAAGTFTPGDSILFKRGDIFVGTITVTESGSIGSPIVIGSYGTGNNPIITGLSTLTGWVVESGDLYKTAVSGAESQTNMVIVNDNVMGMGRYPDAGTWLTYTTATSSSIVDPEMSSSPDWDGAELVINKNDWTADRELITNHTGTSFTFSHLGGTATPDANRNYFIQNDLRTVTTTGEWYHNYAGGVFYYYGNPSGNTIEIAILNNLINIAGYDYINIVDLDLKGCNSHAINMTSSSDQINIYDCNISYAGRVAIRTYGSNYVEIDGCTIDNCHEAGCYMVGDHRTISNNEITNIGLILGAAYIAHPSGIFLNNTDNTVENNRIEYISWSGINTSSIATFIIRNNFINYPMQVLDDGGGIYYTSSGGVRLVDHNIVLNSGVGAPADVAIARGIYLDAYSSGSTVSNNIVAGCREAGLQIHAGINNTLTNNLLYNNGAQVLFQKIASSSTGTNFSYNKLICRTATQYAFLSYGNSTAELQGLGIFDYNYYARPIDDDYVFYYSGAHLLSDWKALVYPDDRHSSGSPVSVSTTDDLHFIYNDTDSIKYYTLSAAMVDITNASYSGLISLSPWSGLVLIGSGTVTPESSGVIHKYYVDESGNDITGDGSIGSPWALVSYACTQVTTPGDTIYVNPGTINETAQIVKPVGVSIHGAGDISIINSTYASSSSLQAAIQCASTAGTTTDDNSSISYIKLTGSSLTSTAGIFVGYRNNLSIHHVTIEDFIDRGIYLYVSSTYYPLFATGNKIYNCVINNSSSHVSGFAGCFRIRGQSDCNIYNNTSDMTERAYGSNGATMELGYIKKTKIHGNTFTRNDHEVDAGGVNRWNFFVESWDYKGDVEYYENTHYGLGQVSWGGEFNDVDAGCTFGVKCHDNDFLNSANGNRDISGGTRTAYAINIEGDQHREVYVYRNYIQRYAWGIELSTPTSGVGYWHHNWEWDGVYVYYNIIENVGYADHAYSYGIVFIMETDLAPYYGVYDNILIANNVITGSNDGTYPGYYGIHFNGDGTFNGFQISNNIIYDFINRAVNLQEQTSATCVINDCDITHNDFHSNGTDDVVWDAALAYTNRDIVTGNITAVPLFVSATNYQIQEGSSCIDTGTDVGLTEDYLGNIVPYNKTPDIGAYEYSSHKGTAGSNLLINDAGVILTDRNGVIIRH